MATIVAPIKFTGTLMQLAVARRGELVTNEPLGESVVLKFRLPLAETITGFFDEVKGATSGYASFEYEPAGYASADVVRIDILLNGKRADPLATLVHRGDARTWGVRLTQKLRDVIDRQLFEVIIQAAVGAKIVCRGALWFMRRFVRASDVHSTQSASRRCVRT